jgi:hypothetical protein
MVQWLQRARFAGVPVSISQALVLTVVLAGSPQSGAGQNRSRNEAAQPHAAAPAFTDEQATSVLDSVQGALQSYDRKELLAQFDSARMANFPAFRNEIKALFDRYDSFTVTYHLLESAMQEGNGVALADFGLDATSVENDTLDLRRHAQLRIVVAWNGKEWKIVDLSPRTIFE